MKAIKNIFILFLLVLKSIAMQAQEPIQSAADSIAKKYLAENKGAMQIGVFINGKGTIYSYGELKPGSKLKPDSETVYELGQLTQVFTSSLYAFMSIHGDVNPDQPVSMYLPVQVAEPVYNEIICEPVERMTYPKEEGYGLNERFAVYVCRPDPSSTPQPILVCYLGTHTSGLPQRPDNMKNNSRNPYAGYSKDKLYEFLRGYTLPTPVGFNFHYTDLDMALLGHIMELKSGKSYERILDSLILSGCGMKNTFIAFPEGKKATALPGYDKRGKETPFWDFEIMGPAAGIKSTAGDMMKFLSANLNSPTRDLYNALNYTHNSRIRFKSKMYGNTEAGLGWLISPLTGDVQYVWQEGVTSGFASFIGFVESGRYGVVVLSNHGVSVRDEGKKMLEEIAKNKRKQ